MYKPAPHINKAVYFVLHSRCDTSARDHIKSHQMGTTAILALRQKLAQLNTTKMHRSFRDFLNIHQGFREPISDFIDRFTKKNEECLSLNVNLSNNDLIELFLNSASKNPLYAVHINQFVRTRKDEVRKNLPLEERLTLDIIWEELLSIDEDFIRSNDKFRKEKAFSINFNKNTIQVICSYCGKKGHNADECRKRLRDKKEKSSKQPIKSEKGTTRRTPSDLSKITCYKCGKKGHYSNKCPENQQANAATDKHTSKEEMNMLMEAAMSATTPDQLFSRGPSNDIRNWLIDSGATSHFTPFPEDLIDIESCQIDVTVADGSQVIATQCGKVILDMKTDQGKVIKLTLGQVLYVRGLSRRLFSVPSFCRNYNYTLSTSRKFTQLNFGDGLTVTIPLQGSSQQANEAQEKQEHEEVKTLPIMSMELAHLRMGHRSFRSLMAGSLHNVWSDYKLSPKTDEFCEGCKIATSRSAARQHIGTPAPDKPFTLIYGDIIHPISKAALTPETAFPCYLFLVCATSKYTWFEGMNDFSSEAVIATFSIFQNQTGKALKELQYFRTDAGKAFTSNEFGKFA